MRQVLLVIVILITLLAYNSKAENFNLCDNCSLIDEAYLTEDSYQWMRDDSLRITLNSSTSIISKADTKTSIVKIEQKSDQEEILFKSQIDRLDDILNHYKNEDGFFASTKKSIDILSEFRRGENEQDVLVPLGFFLYLNKKF